jgi:hypothetical protein
MAFLESKGGLPDFNKAVISLWFRVPQSSIDACVATYLSAQALADEGDYSGVNALLSGIIPLVVFGAEGERSISGDLGVMTRIGEYTQHTMVVPNDYTSGDTTWVEQPADYGWDPGNPSPYTIPIENSSPPFTAEEIQMNPSTIGIDCRNAKPTLYINFETGARPTVTGYTYVNGAHGNDAYNYFWPYPNIPCPIPQPENVPTNIVVTSVEDVSAIVHDMTVAYTAGDSILVAADIWHHVLVSIDLSNPTSILGVASEIEADSVTSAPQMWVAFDDLNYTGKNMSTNSPSGGRPNDVLPAGAFAFIGQSTDGEQIPVPYSYNTEAPIRAHEGVIGVPAPSAYANRIYQVQMAELQIFTGVALDTSVEANRRAFINSKGQPVDEAYGVAKYRGIYGPKSPNVVPSAPVELLGKKPDVAIVRSARNWMSGFDFNKTSFRPNGKIRPVKPDPVVGK